MDSKFAIIILTYSYHPSMTIFTRRKIKIYISATFYSIFFSKLAITLILQFCEKKSENG